METGDRQWVILWYTLTIKKRTILQIPVCGHWTAMYAAVQ